MEDKKKEKNRFLKFLEGVVAVLVSVLFIAFVVFFMTFVFTYLFGAWLNHGTFFENCLFTLSLISKYPILLIIGLIVGFAVLLES